jgi:hypothetical protein
MEYKRQEWLDRFGAKIRKDQPATKNEPVPEAIVAKLKALADAERRRKNTKKMTD